MLAIGRRDEEQGKIPRDNVLGGASLSSLCKYCVQDLFVIQNSEGENILEVNLGKSKWVFSPIMT